MSLNVMKKKSLDCHECKDLVDQYVESDNHILEEIEKRDEIRLDLDDRVAQFRRCMAEEGEISNTVYVRGENVTVTYQFQNRFKNAPTEYEAEIDEHLGQDLRKQLFKRDTIYKVRTDNIEGLRAALGDRFNEFVEETEVVVPEGDFRTKVLHLRNKLSDKKKVALDFLEEMFCARPCLKR